MGGAGGAVVLVVVVPGSVVFSEGLGEGKGGIVLDVTAPESAEPLSKVAAPAIAAPAPRSATTGLTRFRPGSSSLEKAGGCPSTDSVATLVTSA